MPRLFNELRRRNVIRVAVAYAVASWVVLQISDLVLENIGAPDWVMQAFMLLLGLGFPLAVIFSWAYEMTPEGLKREQDVNRDRSITHHTASKLDKITVGLLVLVLGIVGAERLIPGDAPPEPPQALPTVTAEVSDKSIAVLAFKDMSPEGNQAYFAEGISEELLNVLAQIPDLNVAGRTSSFAFKDQNRDLREIGEILEVEHILEGSVRTSGNRVRVTAQLVKADDGFHLFSRNYDRELTDIFEVQDEIAQEIVTALRSTILGEKPIETAKETSVRAYEKYLQARQWIHTRDKELMGRASILLDEALAIDPDYAPALAQKALSLILLSNSAGSYGEIPAEVALQMSRPLLDRALLLDSQLAEAHAVLGLWYNNSTVGYNEEAENSLRDALAIAPKMANAHNWLAINLGRADQHNERVRLYETVVENDPLYGPAFNNVIFAYAQTRELDKADSLIRRVERIQGQSPDVLQARGSFAVIDRRLSDAAENLAKAYDYNPSNSVTQLWYGGILTFLGEYDTASEVSRDTNKLIPLTLAGRHDAAQAHFDSLQLYFYDKGDLRDIGDWMLMVKTPEEFIAFLESRLADGEDLISSQPRPEQLWGASHFTNLAASLLQTGRDEEANRIIEETREILLLQEELGADNLFYWYNRAEFAAVVGDVDDMYESLRNSVASGLLSVPGFFSAAFNAYRGQPEFIKLEEESIRLGNAESRKLGLLAM